MNNPEPGSRPDRSKAIAVEAGLDLLKTEGRAAAAAFMEDAGVPLAVIARVLNEPDRRRLPARADPQYND